MKRLILVSFILLCAACTAGKVAVVSPETGYFKTSKFANTVTSKDADLDAMKSLLLIPNEDFVKGQIANIMYFDALITIEELEKEIVINNLQDQVPNVQGSIGVNKAYKEFKPFLWFRVDTRGSGTEQYAQFKLTDPETLDDIFVAEIHLDYIWEGVNDQSTWYPLFNELIRYIEKNSSTYRNLNGDSEISANQPNAVGTDLVSALNSSEQTNSNNNARIPNFTGTYESRITSNSTQTLRRKYRNMRLKITQSGNKIEAVDIKYQTRISGKIDGDLIRFYIVANKVTGQVDIEGEWKVNENGTILTGKWVARNSFDNSSGVWNLRKIE